MNKQIKQAINEGKLIPYKEVMNTFSKKERADIERGARYIVAANEVRKLRKEMNLTQSQLADKMDVKRELIARVESGKQNVTLETLFQIAEAAGKQFKFGFK